MDRKLLKYLADMLSSILEIESFMAERPKNLQHFVTIHYFGEV